MKTGIKQTFEKWLPEIYSNLHADELSNDYEVLKVFAEHTIKLMQQDDENVTEILKIVNLIYKKASLYERNAVENEFFTTIAKSETATLLKYHLELMPQELKGIYIKTIIEN